ncbi:hypothetical protein GCM10011584_22800 [Nocardioides phosphati]|uniref:PKD domain-containing protein n=1 Tax=Nocardioides phosphati TaxID=1867775 RepID=A0ABQ2NCA1_9ACTN|nr:PKD domain-containing protein [Nocardioides phosphati]GGO90610.1 hypothetical protein GCM10011584_22800 [Nocardioides phosphati]
MQRALSPALRGLTGSLVAGLTLSGIALAAPAQALDILNSPPTAVASATPNPAHAGDTVTLLGNGSTDKQTATAQLAYAWTFGDGSAATGSSSANISVDHVYANAGVYTATLTVTDPNGASDTDQVVVNVDDTAPVAHATATPSPAKVEQAVAFDGSGSADQETADAGLSFSWAFGDTTTGTGVAPTHAYAKAGTYAVTLTVTDPQGVAATTTLTVQVTNTAPTAAGTITPAAPSAGQAVTFDGSPSTDAETPASLTYSWDFGDGSAKATTPTPAHTYAASGSYPVKLTVTDPQGLANTKSWSLAVAANKKPVATLTASQTKANVGQTVSFDGSTSSDQETAHDQLAYTWSFGDGTDASTVTGPTTSHAFAATGSYPVTLTVTDANGQAGTATITITVGNTAPTAAATVTPQPAYALQQVTFDASGSSDAETPDGLTYSWTYGDGTAATAYAASPVATHVYATAGSRTATLRVKDPVGAITSKLITVSVLANAAPVAKATATPNPAHIGQQVTFDGTGSTDADGDALTYAWTFPDDSTATTATTTHTFSTLGTQHVTLEVTDTHGVSHTTAVDVVVANQAPVAKATATPNPAHPGQQVTFDATGSTDADGDALTYAWTFPDGSTASTATTTHTFSTLGTQHVTLEVTDTHSASHTTTVDVVVANHAPVAKATATPTTTHVGSPVTFDGTGSTDADGDALTYAWTFPDGSTATGSSASHTWDTAGGRTVQLTVTDTHGSSASTTVAVSVVNDAPTAAFTRSATVPLTGRSVTFDATGSGDTETPGSLTYAWSVDGAAPVTGPTVAPTFTTAGTHRVALTVTDPQGASTTLTRSVAVARAVSCGGTSVTRDGYWKSVTSQAEGGHSCRNTVAGKGRMTVTASGTRFGLTFGRVSGGGTAYVYVDGGYVGSVSMASTSTTLTWDGRRVFTGLAAGKHTIVVRQAKGIGNIDNLLVFGALG